MRNDDQVTGQMLPAERPVAGKIEQDPFHDVFDIAVSFAEIFVFERLIGMHQTVGCLHDGPFGVGVACPDVRKDFGIQRLCLPASGDAHPG